VDPLFEVMKVKHIRVGYLLGFEPFEEEREVLPYLLPVENTIHHVAAEKS